MPVVKLIKRGFEAYTGIIGAVEFKEGTSVESISAAEADRLGCMMQIECVDSGDQISSTSRLVKNRAELKAEVKPPRKMEFERRAEAEAEAEAEATKKPARKPRKKPVAKKPVAEKPNPEFTLEELEGIADSKGLEGLLEFAEPFEVRGESIPKVIADLMALKLGKD